MSSIDALQLSFQSPVVHSNKSFKQKSDSTTTKETGAFSMLFASISSQSQPVSEDQTIKIIKKLEEVLEALQALQEIPLETMPPEVQDMMYQLEQMLSVLTMKMEDMHQRANPVQEKPTKGSPTQDKLMNLFHQELQVLSTATTKLFENSTEFVGVEEKIALSETGKFEQVIKQLVAFVQQLESEQQATGKQLVSQQIEQFKKVLKQLTGLTEELGNQTPAIVALRNNGRNGDTSLPVPISNTILQQQQQQLDGDGLRLDPIHSEETSQVLTGPALDTLKTSQASRRTEASIQTTAVHMSNLTEELGEVLRGSFRLSGTQEGTQQIRVNVFPEHLGHIDILLTTSNGKISAQILTSNLIAKEALDFQVNQLRNSLLQQGVSIDKIEISHQNPQQSFGHQNAHPDHRFQQHQQKQESASRDTNGYQRMEEDVIAENNPSADGLKKIDYTV